MGFDTNAIKLLLMLNRENVKLGKTVTLGRQTFQLDKNSFTDVLSRAGIAKDRINVLTQDNFNYVEPFLKELGATEVDSMDASTYESATYIHDLNSPVPPSLKDQYDTVIDAGTLEHIFNFPTAVKNCMEMIKVGGHFIGITITNNFPGHGFYQFSPELFFRIFSPDNGFETERMFLTPNQPRDYWYMIPDPKQLKKRIIFENSKQTLLLIVAKKIAEKEIFKVTPQQSDYELLAWQGKDQFPQAPKSLAKKTFSILPDNFKNNLRRKMRILDPRAWKVFLRDIGNSDLENFKKIRNI